MSATGKQLLDAWMEEYRSSRRGHDSLIFQCDVEDGRVHLHGRDNNTCALTFMYSSGCVTPVVVGSRRKCMDVLSAMDKGDLAANLRISHPPPALRIHGIDRLFMPVCGRGVVGVVEDGTAIVLLGFVQGRWALAYCEPGWSEWMFAGERLGIVDLDLWRQMHPRPPSQPPPPPPPPPPLDEQTLEALRLHQILLGPDDDGDDPQTRVGRVVIECLEVQVQRAPFDRQRRLLDFLVALIVELGQKGLRADPVGTKGELAEKFSRVLGRPVTPDVLGESLRVARDLGCSFVSLSRKIWTLRLCELTNLRSEVHRDLLEQARSSFSLGEARRIARSPRSSTGWRQAARTGGPTSTSPIAPNEREAQRPEAVSSPPAGDWLGLTTGLMLVANLFAAALEERTTACAELRGLVEFHHRSLKQSRQAHEDERDRWAGERAAAQADRESAFRTIDALVAELAAIKAERDAQAREVVALRADLAQAAGRIEQLEATIAMIRGLRQVERVEVDEPESTTVALHGDAMTTNESEDGRCSVTTMLACAWVITGLGLQASRPGTDDPSAPSTDLCPSLIMRFPPVLADVCDGRRVLNAAKRSRGSLGPRGPPRPRL
ncbi:hypothetical protein [Nannocystis pusilla]|uniref:hypothetical protein n=1 Tax=Nannocystis pusilla TaxID=889268 RepID=UPI003BF1D94B